MRNFRFLRDWIERSGNKTCLKYSHKTRQLLAEMNIKKGMMILFLMEAAMRNCLQSSVCRAEHSRILLKTTKKYLHNLESTRRRISIR